MLQAEYLRIDKEKAYKIFLFFLYKTLQVFPKVA